MIPRHSYQSLPQALRLLALVAAAGLLGLVFGAVPADGASGTVQVRARILEPIQVEGGQAMSFGSLLSDKARSGEGLYRLAPDGTLSVEGGMGTGGGEENGRFTFSGKEGQSFTYETHVSRDFSDAGLSLVAVHAGAVGRNRGSGAFSSGASEISIGGDLKVTGAPATGRHSDAEITLTVSYD